MRLSAGPVLIVNLAGNLETFSTRIAREPRQRPPSVLVIRQKGGRNGETTVFSAVPPLGFHRSEGVRASRFVRVFCPGPAAP